MEDGDAGRCGGAVDPVLGAVCGTSTADWSGVWWFTCGGGMVTAGGSMWGVGGLAAGIGGTPVDLSGVGGADAPGC